MTVKNPKTSLRTLFGLAVVACLSAQPGVAQTEAAPKHNLNSRRPKRRATFGHKWSFTETMPKVRFPIRKQPFGQRSANHSL
jgi:hypothetical protein